MRSLKSTTASNAVDVRSLIHLYVTTLEGPWLPTGGYRGIRELLCSALCYKSVAHTTCKTSIIDHGSLFLAIPEKPTRLKLPFGFLHPGGMGEHYIRVNENNIFRGQLTCSYRSSSMIMTRQKLP
jgi:hypothetical protein